MPELQFRYETNTEMAEPPDLDFNTTGNIYVMIGDISPINILDKLKDELFDIIDQIHQIAEDLAQELRGLYPNATIVLDKETEYDEFWKYIDNPDTIGAVFIGHGKEGKLNLIDSSFMPTPTQEKADLQFLFLFACEAGMKSEDLTWKSATKADVYYAPEEGFYHFPLFSLPFLETLSSKAEEVIDKLKYHKSEWLNSKKK